MSEGNWVQDERDISEPTGAGVSFGLRLGEWENGGKGEREKG
jgi:hypothetical protein